MTLAVSIGGVIVPRSQRSALQIKSSSPGGFESVSFNLNRSLTDSLLDPFADVLVFDSATGEQAGGGRLMEPTRNDDGTWQITCLGEGFASMHDRKTPIFYVDQNPDNFRRSSRTTKRLEVSQTNYPGQSDEEPTLFMDATEGSITANSEIITVNRLCVLCDMQLGGFGFRHKSGGAAGGAGVWFVRGRAYNTDLSAFTSPVNDAWSATISSRRISTVNGDFPAGRTVASISWKNLSTMTANEDTWSAARDVVVRSQIYGQNGVLRTTGYTNEYILPHEVFIDWVARYCPRLDIGSARIDQSTEQIDQLTYLDGIDGVDLMVDVRGFDPAFAWHVWEKGDGGWVTEFVQLSSEPRYEASVRDGFVAPTPSNELFDRVTVTGRTAGGRDVNYTKTSTVQALDDIGLTREDTIPAGEEVWSTSNAAKVGTGFLDEHAVAPNAGTLKIARSILDYETGRWVPPQLIRPGGLIRVRGVQATPDSLNATSPDGVTVFRIVSVTYDEDSRTATLELDTYTLDETRAIADLYKRGRKR